MIASGFLIWCANSAASRPAECNCASRAANSAASCRRRAGGPATTADHSNRGSAATGPTSAPIATVPRSPLPPDHGSQSTSLLTTRLSLIKASGVIGAPQPRSVGSQRTGGWVGQNIGQQLLVGQGVLPANRWSNQHRPRVKHAQQQVQDDLRGGQRECSRRST